MLRIETPLSDELEDVVHRTIGCCIQVHKALGPGLPERAYKRATCLELSAEGINVHRAQLRSYLRISKLPVGMLMNFNVAVLPDGMKRIVL